ncbi:TniB family NTP-binding protein [Cuspidothrix issatschenkoi LEGE 03284]|jgi:DNA transposition AAA+ family ATPase|uniref:Transposase n=1 Tax=Cuspidothrix issatschenkoi CHARLIE-1 TaxID=2052836 RepID=A0A2S6CWA0_9CYAN|nr:TniB family NTP-binding protein [Cuspidothrix issatschenkoi]MBE9230454.1 TniB family NTP-binding protein [Cuspidothrix issatschenkoi LEGE 03284]PPJ64038.1 transposase [Cuspidothrix issatschenkoi CHARLIE-1]
MISQQAQGVAQELGDILPNDEKLQAEIHRLNRKSFIPLEQVKMLHDWLDGKRQSRQSGRVLGESRTGKTMGCDAYRLRHKPKQEPGKPPTVPVAYIQIPQECSAKELFAAIIEHLKYQMTKGTVAEIRDRTLRVLKGCGVEMLIIDEADRFKPKTFAEVRDIFDKLEIAVILVGTDRLDAVIKRDEQVYNRFRACHRFGKFSGEDFKRTVEIWERQVLKLPVASNLSGKAMLKTLGEATGGYIGLLDMILRESAIRALKKGLSKIDLETLKEVTAEYK